MNKTKLDKMVADKPQTPRERAAVVHDLIMEDTSSWQQSHWGLLSSRYVTDIVREPKNGGRWTEVSCPTTACVAGWTTALAGDHMVVSGFTAEQLKQGGGNITADYVFTAAGELREVGPRGMELLGLKDNWLFQGGRTYREVLYALEELAEGKPPSCLYESRQDGSCDCDSCYYEERELIPEDWEPKLLKPTKKKIKVEHVTREAQVVELEKETVS